MGDNIQLVLKEADRVTKRQKVCVAASDKGITAILNEITEARVEVHFSGFRLLSQDPMITSKIYRFFAALVV